MAHLALQDMENDNPWVRGSACRYDLLVPGVERVIGARSEFPCPLQFATTTPDLHVDLNNIKTDDLIPYLSPTSG